MGSHNNTDYSEVLTEVSIGNYNFHVTRNPFEAGSCILWLRDAYKHPAFSALGKFSGFDKRKVLEFVVKYSSDPAMRSEITKRRFEKKLDSMTLRYFERFELLGYQNKAAVYRSLFDLDPSFELADLSAKRRMMVKRFHPDAGGDNRAMAIINEAYDYLSTRAGG